MVELPILEVTTRALLNFKGDFEVSKTTCFMAFKIKYLLESSSHF